MSMLNTTIVFTVQVYNLGEAVDGGLFEPHVGNCAELCWTRIHLFTCI